MIERLIEDMEKAIDTDEFSFVVDECFDELSYANVGFEAVEPLLSFMERHPLSYFGDPGEIVRFVERFYENGYEELLLESVKRKPTIHTLWMLKRIINSVKNKEPYQALLEAVAQRDDIEPEVKQAAKGYL